MPRVTSAGARSAATGRRKLRRSTSPPRAATRSPPTTAAVQKSKPCAIKLVARYAPSMKNEPCVRLGIFMRPKISENPADSRKSRPPRVTLLIASTTQRFMACRAARGGRKDPAERPRLRSRFQRRIVAGVHGLREEPLLVVRPELADLGIGLDRRVDELVALLLAFADIEGPDHVAEVVERERASRRVGQRQRAQRPDQ